MSLYIKKPVIVEAMQWDGSWDKKLTIEARWPSMRTVATTTHPPTKTISYWSIDVGGRSRRVYLGYYIIKHSNGDFEVLDAESFNEMYEYVE
ncbi:hypothetical protein P26059A_0069 [Curvibacter phage P26059A]|nr:hypothetical protein P26059A_0069 [Curvibacter phage P26059A]